MIDLNALRVFERVASLQSFSAAARSLGSPKSSVSRSVAQLEAELGTRLFQRATRAVVLTESGVALRERCGDILTRVDEAVDYLGTFGAVLVDSCASAPGLASASTSSPSYFRS